MLESNQLPAWYRVVPYINEGYRKPSTLFGSFISIFQWHNETLNIHTHLWPFLYFIYSLLTYKPASTAKNICIYLGYLGAITCTGTSTFYHIVNNNKELHSISLKLDFIGIIMINLSHLVLDTYLLFENKIFYTILIYEIVFALYCIKEVMIGNGRFWALIYPIICCSLNIPLLYLQKNGAIYSVMCSSIIIGSGCVFFKGKIPERCLAGTDYWNSHVWHHCCIIAAILSALSAEPYL